MLSACARTYLVSCSRAHHTQLWLAGNRRSSRVFCDPAKEQQLCACVCARVRVCACAPIYLLVRLKRKRRLPLSILNDAKRVMSHPSKAWLTVDKQQFQKLYSLCVVFLCGLVLKYFQGNNVSVFIRGRSRISTFFFPFLHFTGLNNNVLRFNQA